MKRTLRNSTHNFNVKAYFYGWEYWLLATIVIHKDIIGHFFVIVKCFLSQKWRKNDDIYNMDEKFWERIEKATVKGFTRKQLAADCGISVSTISMWKLRHSYPTADIAVKLANALGTSVEYLVDGIAPSYLTKSDVALLEKARYYKNVIDCLDALSPEGRGMMIVQIEAAAEDARRRNVSAGSNASAG